MVKYKYDVYYKCSFHGVKKSILSLQRVRIKLLFQKFSKFIYYIGMSYALWFSSYDWV